MQRIYIDSNAGVGRMNHKEVEIPYTGKSLLDDMKYYRVHASIVYSHVARDYSFIKGNTELLELINENKRLFGAAVIVPDIKYELNDGAGYLKMLVDKGIRALKMFPESCVHGFDPFNLEEIAEFMEENSLPLIIDVNEVRFSNLKNVLDAFEHLKILLCNTSWSTNRELFRLMEKYENLYFEISSNQANDILAVSKRFFGLDRVLFGTDYPNKVMGGLKALIEYSGLSEEDKNKVAGGNAAKLFNLNTADLSEYADCDCMFDSIASRVDSGLPLVDLLVIDSHTHMVDKGHMAVSSTPIFNGDEDYMIMKMDSLGIDKIITSPWEGVMTGGDSANETALHACEKYPGRIEAYGTFNPNYEEDLKKVIGLYHEKCMFKGIKPYYPKHCIDLLDKRYDEWFKYGDENNLFILVHSDNPEIPEIPQKIETLSEKYKNMAFIFAHSGLSYEMARHNIAAAKKRDNIYLEITYTALTNGIIEYMVQEIGAERVLYGSDMPMRDPAPQLAWVCYARISEVDKRKILGENMKKLLDRCHKDRS